MTPKKVYISWHYITHGIAYLKHILSKFYLEANTKNFKDGFVFKGINQEEMNKIFDNPSVEGFKFDEIVYLTTEQKIFDKVFSRRVKYKKEIIEKDELIRQKGMQDIFGQLIENEEMYYDVEKMLQFVEKNYPDRYNMFKDLLWRNIHYFPIKEQVDWLLEYSNFNKVYKKEHFKVVKLNVTNLRDERQITKQVSDWCKEYFAKQEKQPIINISLGSPETQVAWYVLAEANILPPNTRFIKTYDDKNSLPDNRFKLFTIQEIPKNLVTSITQEFKIFTKTESPSRKLAEKKLETFLQSGFSILLIGERGIGKSQFAVEAKKRLEELKLPVSGNLIEANCASFDDDSKAEAELFGYKKGAFTGANQDKKGLFEEADKGILFLDEVHHLSKFVQAKLMKAIQTDQNNKMSIRPLGSNKEVKLECRLIFATNKKVEELKQILLPDFYDRIVQYVVEIPPLRENVEDREQDWESVWRQLKFEGNAPKEEELINWLKTLPLYGNYRDLQKIAMYYQAFQQFDEETKKMIPEKTPFKYAKNEFEKYHSLTENITRFNFDTQKTTDQMIAEYKYELQDWAVKTFGGRKKAIEHFKKLGESITEKTLNNWKNKKNSL